MRAGHVRDKITTHIGGGRACGDPSHGACPEARKEGGSWAADSVSGVSCGQAPRLDRLPGSGLVQHQMVTVLPVAAVPDDGDCLLILLAKSLCTT